MSSEDVRRLIPRTDVLLALPEVAAAQEIWGAAVVREKVREVQERARRGAIAVTDVAEVLVSSLTSELRPAFAPVINATGVIVHTNLGRAPLSEAAVRALVDAAGYVDVEFDLETGVRSQRGAATRASLLSACPSAEDVLVVNNGAAALSLASTALAVGRDIVLSRGEFIEIGAGFRLSELMESTGARICEVGTTNRTRVEDYERGIAQADHPAAIVKIHASNYVIQGFTQEAGFRELADLAHSHDLPLIVDIGSGLLEHEPLVPREPAVSEALEAGADLVLCSGDKLLGGPQAGIIFGRSAWVQRLAHHPLARAFRADKLQLAALEATVRGPLTPVMRALRTDPEALHARTQALAERVRREVPAHLVEVVAHDGRVGGGGGAEVPLPGWALRVPQSLARELRMNTPAIVGTVSQGGCVIDVRCVGEHDESHIVEALVRLLHDDARR